MENKVVAKPDMDIQGYFTGFWLCTCDCGFQFSAANWEKINMTRSESNKKSWVALCPGCHAVSDELEKF